MGIDNSNKFMYFIVFVIIMFMALPFALDIIKMRSTKDMLVKVEVALLNGVQNEEPDYKVKEDILTNTNTVVGAEGSTMTVPAPDDYRYYISYVYKDGIVENYRSKIYDRQQKDTELRLKYTPNNKHGKQYRVRVISLEENSYYDKNELVISKSYTPEQFRTTGLEKEETFETTLKHLVNMDNQDFNVDYLDKQYNIPENIK